MDVAGLIAQFDFINRLEGLLCGAWYSAHGRGTAGIRFTPPAGASAADMQRVLTRRGVPVFGRAMSMGLVKVGEVELREFTLHTTATQARWAEYCLCRAGAKVWNLQDPRSEQWAEQYGGAPPPAWVDGGRAAQPVEREDQAQAARTPKQSRARKVLRELW